MEEKVLWHNLTGEEVAILLYSNIQKGLTGEEVMLRQLKFGKNALPEEKPPSRLRILFEQFKSPLVFILLIAGIVTLVLREFADSTVIFGALFLNALIGYLQENKTSRALLELKKAVKHEAQVIRGGSEKIIDSSELVPGDVFILSPGSKVPVDGRVVESFDLKVNEMVLSGEWLPASKESKMLAKETSLADRDNMVYMGTIVEDGKAKVVATETGSQTEIGKVAEMIKETKEEKSPLQKKLVKFSKLVGLLIAAISLLIFLEGILTGNSVLEMFTTAVAVAVASIPEGLPVAMTVILALGMERILKRKGLVRKLASAETLGSTSIICTDKTATLTEGKIKVTKVLTNKPKKLIAQIALLCNEAFVETSPASPGGIKLWGRPTDKALLAFGLKAGLSKEELEKKMPKLSEIPFNNQDKMLATLRKLNSKENILFLAGAPEKVLEMSKLTNKSRAEWKEKLDKIASQGFRTIALTSTKTKETKISDKLLHSLEFAALLGLSDPLRKGVKETIKIGKRAGLRPILVTGDHKLTARFIAREIGLKTGRENIIEGKELDALSDEEFKDKVKDIDVYARVEPRHKLKIVEAWQERGEVVAMTGDGINDAPALKRADIGVALGSGTAVAKEVSDLVLLTDNFNIIVRAVEEGRVIIDNIRKVITYLLSDSFTEIILIGTALLLGWPLPVLAAQILWVNLIEDGPLSIVLAFEPKEKDIMEQKPQKHNLPLLTREMKALIFIIGLATDFVLLGLFFWLLKYSGYEIGHIRTVVFAGLTIGSMFYIFSCKSLRKNIWRINPLSNKFLILAWLLGAVALVAAIYFPPLQALLKTQALSIFDWQLVLGLGLLNLLLIEVTKWYFISRGKAL